VVFFYKFPVMLAMSLSQTRKKIKNTSKAIPFVEWSQW